MKAATTKMTQVTERTTPDDFTKHTTINPSDHFGLVHKIARKLHRIRPYLDLDDLVQDGMVGLMRAHKKFDASRGFAFSTYATYWIRVMILNGINNSDFVRLPLHIHESGQKGRKEEAKSRVGKDKIGSIDACISDPADTEPSPETKVEREEISEKVRAVLAELDESSKALVMARMEGKTNIEIGKMIGRSYEIARQRTNKAFNKLKAKLVEAGMEHNVQEN